MKTVQFTTERTDPEIVAQADLVIGHDHRVIKDRSGRTRRYATPLEIDRAFKVRVPSPSPMDLVREAIEARREDSAACAIVSLSLIGERTGVPAKKAIEEIMAAEGRDFWVSAIEVSFEVER